MIPLAANNKKMEWIQSIQINKHKQQCVSKSVAKKRTSKGTNHSNRQDLCQSKPFQNYTNVANSRFPCNSHSTVTWSEVITQYKTNAHCYFYAHINPWKYLIDLQTHLAHRCSVTSAFPVAVIWATRQCSPHKGNSKHENLHLFRRRR